jgi:mannose-6-phosphate isomerase-like protein (cupin superfamily)
MLRSSLTIIAIFTILELSAQSVQNVKNLPAPANMNNVGVAKISTDSLHSTYIIWVDDSVRPHYHDRHTELIYVLEGEGVFYRDEEAEVIRAGDYLIILPGTVHSYKCSKGKRTKVLSIQTPEFDGSDRIWVDKQSKMPSKP